jgi:tryptophan 2,3-dioxygenase
MPLNYSSYLKLSQLLELQEPKSDPAEHDEMLFIVIHQVYELWFKLSLHELDKFNSDLSSGRLFDGMATLKRLRMVLKTLVGQLDILETMTPMSFTAFRDRLEQASGFQSAQFREFEFPVVDHLYDFLELNGIAVPHALRRVDPPHCTEASPELQRDLLDLYRRRPEVAALFESMLDIDEGLQEWRYRHVKLVERTIGSKRGTGGSLGVEFLKRSLFQPIFPDLWAIRHEF